MPGRAVRLIGMTVRMGPKGQVVVPKTLRERLGITPGDEVEVDEVDGEVRIRRAGKDWSRLLGVAVGPDSLTAALEADHRAEIERDERRHRERLARDGRP